jgi:hypothetical protein
LSFSAYAKNLCRIWLNGLHLWQAWVQRSGYSDGVLDFVIKAKDVPLHVMKSLGREKI